MHQDPSAQARRRREPAAVHRNGAETRLPVHCAGRGGRCARPAVGPAAPGADAQRWREFVSLLSRESAGGGVAGIVGGPRLRICGRSEPLQAGPGALSVIAGPALRDLLVALIGAAGVGLGVASRDLARPGSVAWSAVGGAAGGLLVGGIRQVAGPRRLHAARRAFAGNITGGSEGALIGAAVGLGRRTRATGSSARRGAFLGALCGGAAGVAIVLSEAG